MSKNIQSIGMNNSAVSNLASNLKQAIYGQDHAIEAVVDKIKVAKAGLSDESKPIGSFLFTGPTGVGKTELAIEVAKQLDMHFERLDMSEYSTKSDAKNLIGGSAGLVGYEEGGLLTNTIMKYPNCVLLLDEIEKADRSILNTFLQIMDYGVLTSTKGEKAYFQNVIIIMTSNLGATVKTSMGFAQRENEALDDAVNEYLSPEFRARLDAIVTFNPLNQTMTEAIVEKFIWRLSEKLKSKHIELEFTEDVKRYLCYQALKKQLGARGVQKIIETEITQKLSDEILFGRLINGGRVRLDSEEEEGFSFSYTKNALTPSRESLDDSIFTEASDAMQYAKEHPGIMITRSTCGRGWVAID